MHESLSVAGDPLEQFERENGDLLGHDSALGVIYHIHISARYNYIYFATPKVACSSIKETLQRLELNDIKFVRPGEAVHVRSYSPLLSPTQIGSFRAIRDSDKVLKFCFVRNPYTRLLSAYLDKIVRNKPQKISILGSLGKDPAELHDSISFEQFVLAIERQFSKTMDPHWRPQTEHLRIGHLRYNFIGSFENLAEDLDRVADRIGVDLGPFKIANREHATAAAQHLNDYYTPRLIERVTRLFSTDLDYFGYSANIGQAALPPHNRPSHVSAV